MKYTLYRCDRCGVVVAIVGTLPECPGCGDTFQWARLQIVVAVTPNLYVAAEIRDVED